MTRKHKGAAITPLDLKPVQPIEYTDFEGICRPLKEWYEYMSLDQINNLPPRVINALDSLSQMVRKKP